MTGRSLRAIGTALEKWTRLLLPHGKVSSSGARMQCLARACMGISTEDWRGVRCGEVRCEGGNLQVAKGQGRAVRAGRRGGLGWMFRAGGQCCAGLATVSWNVTSDAGTDMVLSRRSLHECIVGMQVDQLARGALHLTSPNIA